MQIEKLAQLFSRFRTYSSECYTNNSPVRVFQKMYSDDHYSRDLEVFLHFQNYMPEQRGADLPWWGKNFFTSQKGFRILMVAQDSLALDAYSIVLYAHLMPIISSKTEYEKYTDKLDAGRSFFSSWSIVKEQLTNWDIDSSFLYVTDAKKVYKKGSWKDRDFDDKRSKELLEAEIEFCNPDLLILLGASPLHLLEKNKNYALSVDNGTPILIQGRKCIISPFLIGNGRAQPNFKKRLEIASNQIKEVQDASS